MRRYRRSRSRDVFVYKNYARLITTLKTQRGPSWRRVPSDKIKE